MYRVLRDLPTFGHIPNKSRSLGDIGKVACSVTPSATCPLNVSLRYPWKIPQQNSHVLFCHSPSRHLQRLGVASSFTRAYYFWHALYSTTWSPNRLVAQSLPHLGVLDITFSDEPVVLLVCNMRSVSKNEIGPHACHCEMSPSRVGKRDHHMWSVVKPWEPRLKRDLQGRTERTLAVRTLSDSCFVDIETGVGWWGLSDSICLLLYEFSTFIPLITDDINQLSFLTWSTSMYRVLRDLPTFGHIPNKSRSLGDIGKVACSVTPSATCPLNVSLRYPWKIPQQNSHVLFCHSPSRHLQRLGVASSFTRAYYFWHALYSTTWSPNRPVAQSLPHLGVLDITFSDEPVVLLNMRSKALGGLQKWDRSSCVSLWNVAIQGWKTRSSHVKCCQTLRTEIETRSSRADRTNFGSEDIEWFLFCWHRNRRPLMRIIGFHMPAFVWVSTFIPLITDDINHLSFLTWSTWRYRVLRDLPTFGHIPNKSRSLGDIGKVACSVTPSATCPLNVSLRYPWKIPQQNSHVLFCHSPSRHLQRLGVASSFTRAYYFWHSLYSTTWSPNRPVAQSLPHLGVLDITFSDEPVVLLVCNMRSKDLGGLQKWDRSSCVSLWNVAIQGWKTRSSHVKCCQTLRTEIETRSSRADRTNFGSEDIEWFLFCWHRNRCRLMRIIGFHMPSFVWVFNIHPPDHRWHQPVVFFDMVDVDVQGSPWSAYLWSHTK